MDSGTASLNIVMVASECSPYAKSGGLADVLGALPKALVSLGHRVAVVLPRYMGALQVPAERINTRLPLELGGWRFDPAVCRFESDGVTYFLVEHQGLYERNGLYGDQNGEFGDNHLRFGLLCRAALEISRLYFPADIFHCHDWQAGLLPLYLKAFGGHPDPMLAAAKTVMTIHNMGYRGIFPKAKMPELSLPGWLYRADLVEFWGNISLLKAGLVYADAITTVSPTYAREIQTPDGGFGLDGLLRAKSKVVTGILNGVDYGVWNPETDTYLPAHYSVSDLSGKAECKRELLRQLGLPEAAMDRPVLGIVSRFADQKGFDLIGQVAWQLFQDDVYLAVLGSGAPYDGLFRGLRDRYPNRVGLRVGYDEQLAHRIEAGSDIFLMPSRYEPCGLNQMYSLRYGTVPVVRAVGGLEDTVESWPPEQSTGFKFSDYTGQALLDTVRAAVRAWSDREAWRRMMVRGMNKDFSWEAAAAGYARLYSALHPFRSSRL